MAVEKAVLGMTNAELIDTINDGFDSLGSKISNIEVDENQNRIAVYLNITTPNTTVTFKNLKGLYKIVWDAWKLDENADSKPYEVLVDKETTEYSHTYERALEWGNEYWVYLYGVTEIGYQAFKDIKFLTNIYLGNRVTLIGTEAFYGCTGLKDLSVPNSVQSIGVSAFHGCTGITEVTLNFGLVTIYDFAFGLCEKLEYINIPYSVTSIGERAFAACYALTDIIIPDSVVTIGRRLFMNCTSLKTVRIGKCVKEIGYSMFDNVPLEVLFLEPINPPKIDSHSYGLSIPTTASIVVSYGFGDNYKKDEYWSRYASQIHSEVLYQGADGYIYQKE
jgi:hypothetical protein